MSVKAYDVLFSLQDVIINFGLNEEYAGQRGLPLYPYTKMSIEKIIERVFYLIEGVRRDNGLFEPIGYCIKELTPATRKIEIPYVLIAKKSAWDVLRDIANFCCCNIYTDRDGEVKFVEDSFAATQRDKKSDICISPDNAYRFSIPVKSRTVVNQVKAGYYTLKLCEDLSDFITIERQNCKVTPLTDEVDEEENPTGPFKVETTVGLDKVYDVIDEIMVVNQQARIVSFTNVTSSTANSLMLEFESEVRNFPEFEIEINWRAPQPVEY